MKMLTKALENQFAKVDTRELHAYEIKIIAHYFFGPFDWWAYDRENDAPDVFWGFVNIGDAQCAECGTFLLSDVTDLLIQGMFKVERDLYWDQSTTLLDVQMKNKPWDYTKAFILTSKDLIKKTPIDESYKFDNPEDTTTFHNMKVWTSFTPENADGATITRIN